MAGGESAWSRDGELPPSLGPYRVIELLAVDALGEKLLARLTGAAGLAGWAVIRRMHANLAADAALVQAFMEGARLATRVHHTNVLPVLDVSDARDGNSPWLAFEHVHGESVADLIDHLCPISAQALPAIVGEPLEAFTPAVPWDIACRVVSGFAQGIDAIFERRQVDVQATAFVKLPPITPDRLMVTYEGEAKVTEACLPWMSDASALPYTAPDRVRKVDGSDVRAHVFGLGVVLWETVAGRRLFVGASEEETIAKIQANVVPSLRAIAQCPEKLDEVVRKALCPDPEQRFSTGNALSRALEAIIESTQVVLTDEQVANYVRDVFPGRLSDRQNRMQVALMAIAHDDVDNIPLSTQRNDMTEAARSAAYSATEEPPTVPRLPEESKPSVPPGDLRDVPAAGDAKDDPIPVRPGTEAVLQEPAALAPNPRPTNRTPTPARRSGRVTRSDEIPAAGVEAKRLAAVGLAALAVGLVFGGVWAHTQRRLASAQAPTTAPEVPVDIPRVSETPAPSATLVAVPAWTAIERSATAVPLASVIPTVSTPTALPITQDGHRLGPAPSEPLRTGQLTVVCVPACDTVIYAGRSLGPSPVFKATVPAGSHRLTLRTSDPRAEKVTQVDVVADETTSVRERMDR